MKLRRILSYNLPHNLAHDDAQVHYDSLHRLVHTPITFFDTTPVGRILNRFSKDTDDMDYQLCVLYQNPGSFLQLIHRQ